MDHQGEYLMSGQHSHVLRQALIRQWEAWHGTELQQVLCSHCSFHFNTPHLSPSHPALCQQPEQHLLSCCAQAGWEVPLPSLKPCSGLTG